MSVSEHQLFQEEERSNWVPLRTLVSLRWFAIAGQATAVLVAVRIYGLQIEVNLSVLAICISIIANFASRFVYPENKRLSERETTSWLVFDILQLSCLLYLTGGLNNPFAMLVMAPVTIAATVLRPSNTIFLGALAIAMMSVIARYHLPIATAEGVVLDLPVLFQFGFWVALLIGVVFLGIYARQVTTEMHIMDEALVATQLALAREQKLTDIGGVIAAAAHELGTPLATIKLVSSELIEELGNRPELLEDVELIRNQVNRCRDILHSMGRAGKDDLHLRQALLETVVREAAEPHLNRGKRVTFSVAPHIDGELAQPIIARRPEIIHGLRNLIQNAVDFSQAEVKVDVNWSSDLIHVTISDDGSGFPPSVLGRIGDPYVKRRRLTDDKSKRPGYEGMGLGLFIAKTLLERSGATLNCSNSHRDGHTRWKGQATGGAIVDVVWPREALLQVGGNPNNALGENQPNVPWP
jgi:two-component system sensor histidine kinase RegB